MLERERREELEKELAELKEKLAQLEREKLPAEPMTERPCLAKKRSWQVI